MEGQPEATRAGAEPDAVIDLERDELLLLLRDVQEDSQARRVVDLDRRGLLTNLRDVQDEPVARRPTVEDDNFLWLD